MAKKQKYYNTKKIREHDADYNIILGGRSTGKSYAIKKDCILEAFNDPTASKFILLRRYEIDIKPSIIIHYFSDMDINLFTRGAYDSITIWQKTIYLSKTLDSGKKERGMVIGYVRALNQDEHYKSGIYTDCKNIIFEEFVSNSYYLPKECYRLQNFVSTVARRNKIKVWMIGNTISRLCPYFSEWELRNIPRQKSGTIDIYTHKTRHTEDGQPIEIKIAVEYTDCGGKIGGMFFGAVGEHIDGGAWTSEDKPSLPNKRDAYSLMHTVYVKYHNFTFTAEFLYCPDTESAAWYIMPKTTPIKEGARIVSDCVEFNDMQTRGFIPLNAQERKAFSYITNGTIFYSDNLTGTDFENCYKLLLRG